MLMLMLCDIEIRWYRIQREQRDSRRAQYRKGFMIRASWKGSLKGLKIKSDFGAVDETSQPKLEHGKRRPLGDNDCSSPPGVDFDKL